MIIIHKKLNYCNIIYMYCKKYATKSKVIAEDNIEILCTF